MVFKLLIPPNGKVYGMKLGNKEFCLHKYSKYSFIKLKLYHFCNFEHFEPSAYSVYVRSFSDLLGPFKSRY